MNACSWSRLLILKRVKKSLDEPVSFAGMGYEAQRLVEVLGSFIEVLDTRLRR